MLRGLAGWASPAGGLTLSGKHASLEGGGY